MAKDGFVGVWTGSGWRELPGASPGGSPSEPLAAGPSRDGGLWVLKGIRLIKVDATGAVQRFEIERRVIEARRKGQFYPYELARALSQPVDGVFPRGSFTELELAGDGDGEALVPANRPHGQNTAHLVVGRVVHHFATFPEGLPRVLILGDPTRGMGSLAEPECRRILAAFDLAEREGLAVEWVAVSSGARIAMDSGTENLDWTARVLARIIRFTQAGGTVNVIVDGVNVGAQSYWNAEATMLQHCRGALIMTPQGSMLLTGKKALEYAGSVSAEDNNGIGGFAGGLGHTAVQFGQDAFKRFFFANQATRLGCLEGDGFPVRATQEEFPGG